jgi:hypothetical protein
MTNWFRALLLQHFWLKLFSLLLAMLLWLAVHASVDRESVGGPAEAREGITNFIARPVLILTDSGAHPAVRIDPPTVDIAVRGGALAISRLDPLDVRAFVRVPDRVDFDGTVQVHVQVPKEASLIMVSPSIVRVRPNGTGAGAPPSP